MYNVQEVPIKGRDMSNFRILFFGFCGVCVCVCLSFVLVGAPEAIWAI